MKKIYNIVLFTALMTGFCANAWGASPFTVANGSSYDDRIPLRGLYVDEYNHSQIIYPSSLLTEMSGNNITSMTFYLNSSAAASWGSARFQIGLKEVAESDFGTSTPSSFLSVSPTVVYTGALDGTGSTMVITFSTPYTYNGGNLLFELKSTATGTYKSASFYGDYDIDRKYSAIQGSSSTSAAAASVQYSTRFIPKTTFTYEAGACTTPTALAGTIVSPTDVSLNWTKGAGETKWNVQYKTSAAGAWTDASDVTKTTNPRCTIPSLTPGTAYNFRVRSWCAADDQSDWSSAITVTPAAVTPTGLTASVASPTSVSLTWTKGLASETAWQIQYRVKGAGSWSSPVDVSTTPSHTLTGLTTNTTYEFQVRSYYGAGAGMQSAWSSTVEATPVLVAPTISSTGTPTETGTTVTWNAVAGVTGYQYIVVARDAAENWASPLTPSSTTSTSITGLTLGTDYDVYVRSVYAGPTYSAGTKAQFTTKVNAPTGLTRGTLTSSSVQFSWTAGGGATQYQWKTTPGSDWSSPISATSVTAEGLSANTSYTFYVRAYYNGKTSTATTSSSFKTPCGTLDIGWSEAFSSSFSTCWTNSSWSMYTWSDENTHSGSYAPYFNCKSNSTATLTTPPTAISDKSVLLYWWKGSANTKMEVYVNSISDANKLKTYNPSSATSWAKDSVILDSYIGQDITFIFRAVGTGSSTGSTRYIRIDDIDTHYKPCATPTSLAAEATADGAVVTWSHAEDGPFDLQYRTRGVGAWTTVNSIAAKTYTITGLTVGTEYEVQVRAHCSANRISSWTSSAYFTPDDCPTVTAVTLTNKGYNSVRVNWTTSATTNCDVRYKTTLGSWTSGGTNISDSYKDLIGLTPEATYTIQVKPSCSADGWVAAESFTPRILPPTPVVTALDTRANVEWESVVGATSYQYICVAKDAAHSWLSGYSTIDSNPTAGSPLVLSGLAPNTAYDLYVRSMYLLVPSLEVKQSFTTTTFAPVSLTCTASTTSSLTFTWAHNPSGSATRYQYRVDGGAWTLLDNNVLTKTLTELSDGRNYTFSVRSYYSEGVYSDAVSLTAATECATKTLPFSENFESGNPLCWSTTRGEWSTDGNNWTVVNQETNHIMRFNARTNQSLDNYLILPDIYLFTDAELTFKVKNSYYPSGSTAAFIDGNVIITDGVTTRTVALDQQTSLTTQTIDLAEFAYKTITIKFIATTSANSTAYIDMDDVAVRAKEVYIFNDYTEDHLWKTANNWDGKVVPGISNDVIVRAAATIDATTVAQAKSVVIDRLAGRTGSIEIEPTGELIIQNTLREATGTLSSPAYGATSEEHLTVNTSASGNGVLAIGGETGTNRATVNFYTKAYKHATDGWINQFIGTPFKGSDIFSDYYGSYLYIYDAMAGWVNQTQGMTSVPFAGYNILRKDAAPTTLGMQGTLCASSNSQELSFTYAGEPTQNMFANSWLAPIDIASMGVGAFDNCEATVYLFNAGSKKQNVSDGGDGTFGGSTAAEGNSSPGQFIALPVASAPWTSPTVTVIPSMQACIVVATAASPTVTLNYSTMVLNPLKSMENATATTATRAPQRLNEDDDEEEVVEEVVEQKPDIMRVHVAGESGNSDLLYVLVREDFTNGFDNGYDGRKLGGAAGIPYLYAFSNDGEMSIHCVADVEGTVVGFEPGEDTRYRLTFTYDGEQTLYLNDVQEQISTLISEESSYVFTAAAGDPIERFVISATPVSHVPTGIGQNGDEQSVTVRKIMRNDKIFILRGDKTYSILGGLVD